ncbi:hypothetical protein AB0J74_22940 [Asanoa sp. NPDC049573]|uniref:hypothetical protein n=1 Tax=Asanoa sp. NPDC049573 TaxID=3155396 RepID=UPI00342ACD7D
MRRGIATLIMVSVVALGAAACGSSGDDAGSASAAGGASASAAAGGASDATATACKEAIAASEAGAKDFGSGIDEMQKMVLSITADSDDAELEAKGTELENKMRASLKTWSDKLTALAGQDLDADVKTALTDAATTVTKINDPNDDSDAAAARTALTGVADKIKAACA